jgi:hypothetical protein
MRCVTFHVRPGWGRWAVSGSFARRGPLVASRGGPGMRGSDGAAGNPLLLVAKSPHLPRETPLGVSYGLRPLSLRRPSMTLHSACHLGRLRTVRPSRGPPPHCRRPACDDICARRSQPGGTGRSTVVHVVIHRLWMGLVFINVARQAPRHERSHRSTRPHAPPTVRRLWRAREPLVSGVRATARRPRAPESALPRAAGPAAAVGRGAVRRPGPAVGRGTQGARPDGTCAASGSRSGTRSVRRCGFGGRRAGGAPRPCPVLESVRTPPRARPHLDDRPRGRQSGHSRSDRE